MSTNSKNNILVLSPFFYPEPISTGKFNTDMVLALKENGNNVTVLCSHPLYPKWKPEKSDATIPGVKIIRGGSKVIYPKKAIIRRGILELWYTYYLLTNIFKIRKNTDIVVTVFPPSLAFFVILPFLGKKVKKVGIVHDLQEVYSQEKKGFVNKTISFIINKVEGATFRACRKLIFLSNEMKKTAKIFYGLDDSKLFVQYPFTTLKENNITNNLESILPKGKVHIVYSGALGEKQNPYGLYDFFDFASSKLEGTFFHFFSQGQIFENLKSKNNNLNIKFHDLVHRDNIEELYSRSTIQIIPQLKGTSRGSLPSKLPNLLYAKCNILIISDKGSEIEKLCKDYSIDKVVTDWDDKIIFDALKVILENSEKDKNHQKDVAKKLFSIDSMIKKIV